MVPLQGFGIKFGSFEGFPGGVTDSRGGSANERDGAVAAATEPGEHDEAEEVAEVEGLRGGVEAAVDLEGWWCEARAAERVAGDGLDQTTLFEDSDDVVIAVVAARLLLLLLEGAAGGFCGAVEREGRRRGFEGTEEAFGCMGEEK